MNTRTIVIAAHQFINIPLCLNNFTEVTRKNYIATLALHLLVNVIECSTIIILVYVKADEIEVLPR